MTDKLDSSARIARKPTGAGAEAAEGIHGAPQERDAQRDPTEQTSLADRKSRKDVTRKGSEPLDSDSHQHRSGYGGEGGKPKSPSDDWGSGR